MSKWVRDRASVSGLGRPAPRNCVACVTQCVVPFYLLCYLLTYALVLGEDPASLAECNVEECRVRVEEDEEA